MKKLLIFLTLVLFAVPAMADIYQWVDEKGTVNFTEDPGNIPKKFRKKAKRLGGEDTATPPAEVREAPPQPKTGGADVKEQAPKEKAPSAKNEKVKYGDKDGAQWRKEFGAARADLKAAEDQLVEIRKRLTDTGSMSRSEYLTLQFTHRNNEKKVLELRKKLSDLEAAANEAGVPAEFRQNDL